jgi:acetyl esterase
MLDPRIRALEWFIRITGKSFRPGATVASVRTGYRELNNRFGFPPVTGVATESLEIPVTGGMIAGRLSKPAVPAAHPLPVLLYFHGGGWVIGDAQCHDHLTRYLAHRGQIAVLSVDYRKGPESPIPIPFEDGFDAYAWLCGQASSLRLDPARIAVGGDSAGGTIAAAISAFSADRGLTAPAYQMLIHPPLDGTLRFPSRSTYRRGDMIVPAMREWFKRHALSDPRDMEHRYLCLVDAPAPERNPPTYFVAAGYDCLIDEGRAYAERLRSAGVEIRYDVHASLPHGLVNVARITSRARHAVDAAIRATASALAVR